MNPFFELIHTDTQTSARAGILHTDHGDVQTPVFMPVGTQASVKAIDHRNLRKYGVNIILGNTYHLYLRPSSELIASFGGLHKFMNYDGAILTDSGGYQVFSLQDLRKISDKGVEFSSHIDGSKHFFSPQVVIDTQRNFGSDIIMPLDECVPYPSEKSYVADSIQLSLKWLKESKERFQESKPLFGHRQFLFGIGQGGMYEDLRVEYIQKMIEMDLDGYAIGGLSVGEPQTQMNELTALSCNYLPKDKPRYLMGVGTPENILDSIESGIDMFDCVMPTRNARNGQLFTTKGKINIRNSKYKTSDEPIDNGLDNYISQNYSLGYLRHLVMSGEILGLMLASEQNIAFYLWLVSTARDKILSGEYRQWKKNFVDHYYSHK